MSLRVRDRWLTYKAPVPYSSLIVCLHNMHLKAILAWWKLT